MSSYASQKLVSVYDELDAPLLEQTEVDYDSDDDEIALRETPPSNLCLSQGAQDEDKEASGFEESTISFIYASLLISQFGMAFCMNQQSMAFSFLVFFSLGLFVVSAAIFKDVLNEQFADGRRSLCILLPEIMVNFIVGAIYFLNVEWGFFTLLFCMIVLKCAVIVMTLLTLFRSNDKKEAKAQVENDLLVCQIV